MATTASKLLKAASEIGSSGPVYWQDARFWLALLAGPICWAVLWLAGMRANLHPPPTAVFLMVAIIYPLLEEIVFRGGVQGALLSRAVFARRWCGLTLANVLTSLLFAAAHLLNQPPVWAALILVPSLVFGWARDRYARITPSIILHMLYNAGFVWLFVNT